MAESPDIRVRFPPEDKALSHLHRAAFGSDDEGVLPWADRLRNHSLTWVGAFDGDELIGFVNVLSDGGSHAFLVDTVVHPAHQRRGLGAAIVRTAAAEAAGAGCIWLHVDYEPAGADFYLQACGFRRTEAGLLRL